MAGRSAALSRALCADEFVSWLNQIERWFSEITRKRIRRDTFRSVRDLIRAINDYVRQYNKNPQPFQWVASASNIVRKGRQISRDFRDGRLATICK